MSSANLTAIPRPQIACLLILSAAAGLVWISRLEGPSLASTSQEPAVEAVPSTVGEWTGKPLALDRRVFEILETRDVASMEYQRGDEPPVWLAQVAGFGTRAAFHPPELCYVGSHFEVLGRGAISVVVNGQPQRLMRLVIGQGAQQFEAWYWFTAGDRVTHNYYQQQLWLLADAFHRKPMSGTLVRISTALEDPPRAHQRLLAFVEALDLTHRAKPAPPPSNAN